MRATRQNPAGGAGLSHVREKFEDLNWGPIENSGTHDLGVDLFLQVRDWRRFDTTVLVCTQVKSGDAKYFKSPKYDESGEVTGWWYAEEDADHFDDWSRHGLPHLLVIVTDGPDRIAYWVHITTDKIDRTGKGCKIFVPKNQRINAENADALMAAAASGKVAEDLQGSVYRAGPKSVPPARTLRHALIAPRLIAPRDRQYDRTLQPEEAIALLTAGRLNELDRYRQKRVFIQGQVAPADKNKDLVSASLQSKDWRWRLFHAVHAFAAKRDVTPAVDLATSTTAASDQPIERRAAATIVAAAALMDAERWTEAGEVLDAAGQDLLPVDHGWVYTHRALVHLEHNEIEHARTAAAEALRAVMTDPDDVTAREIASAAAWILIITADLQHAETAAAASGTHEPHKMLDTAAGWWRATEIAEAQDRYDDITYRTWASSDDLGESLSADSQDRLRGAWLTALLAGSRSEAGWPLALQARHELQHLELQWRDTQSGADPRSRTADAGPERSAAIITRLGEVLDALRRYGRHTDLQKAASRLWKAGPAEAVRDVLLRSLDHLWEPSTARAHVALLTAGGDLLDEADADRAARQCLDALSDVVAFRRQARPTFLEWHFLPRALRRVLTAASAGVHAEVLELVLERAPGADADFRGDLEAMVVNIRNSVVTAAAERVRTFALDQDGSLSATLLQKLAAGGDIDADSKLRNRAEGGDLNAAGAIGRADKLSEPAAQALLNDTVTDCRKIIADAAAGAFSQGEDSARNLVVLNLAFPGLADWETVLDLLADPRVAADAKFGAVTVLTNAPSIPDDVLALIRDRMTADGPQAINSALSLTMDAETYRGQAYAFAVAIGVIDNSLAVQRVLSLLRGSTTQRRSACTVITALRRRTGDALIQGVLIMLTADPQHEVRAAAASALLRGVTSDVSSEAEQALLAAASESGCAVPLQVARVLATTPDAGRQRGILMNQLAAHRSALVRQAVAFNSD